MDEAYKQLPYDLSGARSKNRFRNEMLWGLERLYYLYKTEEDFCMVFDYACDIEVHLKGGFEFYQLKTSNGAKPYTVRQIIKQDSANKSILGKIHLLKHNLKNNESISCKIAVVVNVPLKADKKLYSSVGELEFIDLEDKIKSEINEAIKIELNLSDDVNLKNVFYFYSSMDLNNPHSSLLGKTVEFFTDISGEEPKKVRTLFRVLEDTITMKASYERECKTIEELHEKKGISRQDFEKMIRKHIDISDEAVPGAKEMIDANYIEFSDIINMKNA